MRLWLGITSWWCWLSGDLTLDLGEPRFLIADGSVLEIQLA